MAASTQRLFIGGLAPGITQDELCARFFKFAKVTGVEFKEKPAPSGEAKIFAFATVEAPPQEIEKCISTFNQTKWKGRTITLQIAKESFIDRLKKEREQLNQDGKTGLSTEKKDQDSKVALKKLWTRSIEEDDSESSEVEDCNKNLKKSKGHKPLSRPGPIGTKVSEDDLEDSFTQEPGSSSPMAKNPKTIKKFSIEKKDPLKSKKFKKKRFFEDDSESSEDENLNKNLKKFKGLKSLVAPPQPLDTQVLEADLRNLSTKEPDAPSTKVKVPMLSKGIMKGSPEKKETIKEESSHTVEFKKKKPTFFSILEQPVDSGMEEDEGGLEDEETMEVDSHSNKDKDRIETCTDPRFQFDDDFTKGTAKKVREKEQVKGPCFKPLKRYEPQVAAALAKEKIPDPPQTSPVKKKPTIVAAQKWDAPQGETFRFTSLDDDLKEPPSLAIEPLKFPKECLSETSSEEEEENPLDFTKLFPKAEPETYKPFFFSPKQLSDEASIFKTGVPNKEKPRFTELFKKVRRNHQKRTEQLLFRRRRGRPH